MTEANPGAARYDRRTILFHWLTVLLIAEQWLGAHVIDWFPRGPLRTDARTVHIVIGFVLVGLILARLAWRRSGGLRLPPADKGPLHTAAVVVHVLLYVMVIAVLALGVLNTFIRGDSIFGLFRLPKLTSLAGLRETVGEWHEFVANGILILAGIHALAALWHHFARRDGVLGRMIPALAPKA